MRLAAIAYHTGPGNSRTFGADMFPLLGGLVSGGLNLLGGLFGQQNQAAINQANINETNFANAQNFQRQVDLMNMTQGFNVQNMQTAAQENENILQHQVQWRTADAINSGINPLVALGLSPASGPAALAGPSGSYSPSVPQLSASNSLGAGLGQAGQDIGRAISALADANTKSKALDNELKATQIANNDADVTHKQLVNSVTARTLGAPGSPPGFEWTGPPLPPSIDPVKGREGLYNQLVDDDGNVIKVFSRTASEALMNSASLPIATYLGPKLVGQNLPNPWPGTMQYDVRPDVGRTMFPGYDWSLTPLQ